MDVPEFESRQGQEIFLFSKTSDLWGPPSHLFSGFRAFVGRGMKLTTDLHLVPRLRMSGAVTLLPSNVFVTLAQISTVT
jgi:hypothetical protein